ncbi:MAG TPA: hypothetical protein VFQ67_01610 [Allosphingosinicella sp.]|nr:hypothetical protein [Allosphingosinicella sp.]
MSIPDGRRGDPLSDIETGDLPPPIFVPPATADAWRTAARRGIRQPSQATITYLGDTVVKSAEGQAAIKLRAQADWIVTVRALGFRQVPEILDRWEDIGPGGIPRFAFAMPRYLPLTHSGAETAVAILRALRGLWRLPAAGLPSISPEFYARAVTAPIARLCGATAETFLAAAERVDWPRTAPAHIHGDPTFENTVQDFDGRIVLLDPNVQRAPAVCLSEQDISKVALSCAGWEDFVSGRIDLVAPPASDELVPADGASGYSPRLVRWLAAAHLARTIPYGAKRGDGRLILPSIRAWLSDL